jgi:hypothetical protein
MVSDNVLSDMLSDKMLPSDNMLTADNVLSANTILSYKIQKKIFITSHSTVFFAALFQL